MKSAVSIVLAATFALAFQPPGLDRYAIRGKNGSAILPGGKVIQPAGEQVQTGPGTFRIAISTSGKWIATANLGPERASVTVIETDKKHAFVVHHLFAALPADTSNHFHSVFAIAFEGERRLWVSEGSLGTVRLIDTEVGSTRKTIQLDSPGNRPSFAGAVAWDAVRNTLYVLDPAHSRLLAFEGRSGGQISSLTLDVPAESIAVSADGRRAWVAAASSPGIAAVDLANPASPQVVATAPVEVAGLLSSPAAAYAAGGKRDSVSVLDPATLKVIAEIPLRIAGVDAPPGIQPLGMALDAERNQLFVAEAGLNAVAVIDTRGNRLLGMIPAGWYPAGVAVSGNDLLVANAKGQGEGPSSVLVLPDSFDFAGVSGRGSLSRIPMPSPEELTKQTQLVLAANGLRTSAPNVSTVPRVKHVVLIVKGGHTFDELFGDFQVPDFQVEGSVRLARYGAQGYAEGGKGRFSLQRVNITPNQHELATQFSLSDNFYSDGEPGALDGMMGYLSSRGVHSWACDAKAESDVDRAAGCFLQIEANFGSKGEDLPGLVVIQLPDDQRTDLRPADGYPYTASYVAANDLAIGRVVESLSHSRWWNQMAVFVVSHTAGNGRDHIDAQRTPLIAVGPSVQRGFVSHKNANVASLRRTVFEMLGVPPETLSDATASDLSGMFRTNSDPRPFSVVPVDDHLLPVKAAH